MSEEPPDPIIRELSDRLYLAYCVGFGLDPDEQTSAIDYERWWAETYGDT